MDNNVINMTQRTKPKTVVFVRGMLLVLIAMAGGNRILINAEGQPYMKDFPDLSAETVRFFVENMYIDLVRCTMYNINCYEINARGRYIVSDWARGELKAIADAVEIAAVTPIPSARRAPVLGLVSTATFKKESTFNTTPESETPS